VLKLLLVVVKTEKQSQTFPVHSLGKAEIHRASGSTDPYGTSGKHSLSHLKKGVVTSKTSN